MKISLGTFFTSNLKNRDVYYYPDYDTYANYYETVSADNKKTLLGKLGSYTLDKVWPGNYKKILKGTTFIEPDKYKLPGVESIDFKVGRDVAEVYGLQMFTMVPWYTKLVTLTIDGYYYFGAFETNVAEKVVESTLNMQQKSIFDVLKEEMYKVDEKIRGNSAEFMLSTITLGDITDKDSITMYGFVKDLDFSESVKTPFVYKYKITYIGIEKTQHEYLKKLIEK